MVGICAELLQEYIPERCVAECKLQLESVLHKSYTYEFYDERTWASLIERIEVSTEGSLSFYYIDGTVLVYAKG